MGRLMPDTHTGMGMPIGGVIAAKDVIIPNAVGVDIGCGMNFVATNVRVSDIRPVMTGNGHAGAGDDIRYHAECAGGIYLSQREAAVPRAG